MFHYAECVLLVSHAVHSNITLLMGLPVQSMLILYQDALSPHASTRSSMSVCVRMYISTFCFATSHCFYLLFLLRSKKKTNTEYKSEDSIEKLSNTVRIPVQPKTTLKRYEIFSICRKLCSSGNMYYWVGYGLVGIGVLSHRCSAGT